MVKKITDPDRNLASSSILHSFSTDLKAGKVTAVGASGGGGQSSRVHLRITNTSAGTSKF